MKEKLNVVMRWVKANPISMASIVVIIASLAVAFLVVMPMRNGFTERVADDAKKDYGRIDGFERYTVRLPSEDPSQEPTSEQVVVTESDVELVKKLYSEISEQGNEVEELITRINREGHDPMLVEVVKDPFQARSRYLGALNGLLARLNAGEPADLEEIQLQLNQIEDAPDVPTAGAGNRRRTLTKEEEEERLKEYQTVITRSLTQHATQLGIYVDSMTIDVRGAGGSGRSSRTQLYPLDVDAWAISESGEAGTDEDIWQSQMGLWIQQDIVAAIANANQSSVESSNVMMAPVKRLVSIRVNPAYIGITGKTEENKITDDYGYGYGYPGDPYGGGYGEFDEFGGGEFGPYGSEFGADESIEDEPFDPNKSMAPKYDLSPSGRYSNGLFDVRQATLTVIVDVRHLATLLKQINKVNLTTVVDVDIEDVNEYEHLQSGYLYGPGDMVQATILIESVWLRAWTQPLMPDVWKIKLGIMKDPNAVQEDEFDEDD